MFVPTSEIEGCCTQNNIPCYAEIFYHIKSIDIARLDNLNEKCSFTEKNTQIQHSD